MNATGTYFIPLLRDCVNFENVRFTLGPGVLEVPAGIIEGASCAFGVDTWSKMGEIGYGFSRRSSSENQLLDILYVRPPFATTLYLASINLANLGICGSTPILSGSHTFPPTELTLPNPPGSGFGDPCSLTVTHDFEPILWEIVAGGM